MRLLILGSWPTLGEFPVIIDQQLVHKLLLGFATGSCGQRCKIWASGSPGHLCKICATDRSALILGEHSEWGSTHIGPVAQWITRLTTDQKILGSTPGWLDSLFG